MYETYASRMLHTSSPDNLMGKKKRRNTALTCQLVQHCYFSLYSFQIRGK